MAEIEQSRAASGGSSHAITPVEGIGEEAYWDGTQRMWVLANGLGFELGWEGAVFFVGPNNPYPDQLQGWSIELFEMVLSRL